MNNETRRYAPVLDWDIIDGRKKFKALMVEAAFAPKMYVTEADHIGEVERLSKRIEALQAIIRKGYASFDLQQIRKSLVAIEGMALYFYDDPSETKRSEYLSEALRCRLMIKDYGKDENLDLAARAEAAESKLSQLQLANEEKARKIAEMIFSWTEGYIPIDLIEELKKDYAPDILAILNGGQQ